MIEDNYEKPKFKPFIKQNTAGPIVIDLSGRESHEAYSRKKTEETTASNKPKSKPPA